MKSVLISLWVCLLLAACGSPSESVPEVENHTAVAQAVPTPTTPANVLPSGNIFALEITPGEQNLVHIDAATAVKRTIFAVPENGWLGSFDYQPQREQFVFAYAPPPPEGEVQFGFTHLYLWHEGAAELELLIEPQSEDDIFFNPVWAADGEALYYSQVTPLDENSYTFTTILRRYQLASGEVNDIAVDGIWPAVSADGQKLAFVLIDPDTGANTLLVADADGQNQMERLGPDSFTAMDAPQFSPDGEFIMFSAVESTESSRPWWEILFGIQIAAAHNLPSDWYRIPSMGGGVERLTELSLVGLYGRYAPDAAPYFAFASQDGLYLMSPAGENLEKMVESSLNPSLAWTP